MRAQVMLEAAARGQVAKIPEDQTMDFEYVYTKDVGHAVDLAATIPAAKDLALNIGTAEAAGFQDLVGTAQALCRDFEVEIARGKPPAVPAGQPLEIFRAKAQFGWAPEYPLERGFREYVDDLKVVLKEGSS